MRQDNGWYKKSEKHVKTILTNGMWSGILTKLSGRTARDLKRMVESLKKVLDKLWETVVI